MIGPIVDRRLAASSIDACRFMCLGLQEGSMLGVFIGLSSQQMKQLRVSSREHLNQRKSKRLSKTNAKSIVEDGN